MRTLTVHSGEIPIYDIIFADDFSKLSDALKPLQLSSRKICIVSERRVASFYMAQIKEILHSITETVIEFVFPEGEMNKNLDTVHQLYETLIRARFDRKDLLVALGGGVVGDLTGYTAATYLRGIDFIQLPTSLLAQVDSSIGGKTGVDFNAWKNMVGAFHQPRLVYINVGTLRTLNHRQFLSGMGEIIKHGLIKDADYYQWMKIHCSDILNMDLSVLSQLIYRSCEIKCCVVENDPKEHGERALLNFGHTLGHAVEKLSNFSLLHGECVALGMVCAAYISTLRHKISPENYKDIVNTIQMFGLPTALENHMVYANDILEATKLDKKMDAGAIKFILLDEVGYAAIDKTVTDQEIMAASGQIGAKGGCV